MDETEGFQCLGHSNWITCSPLSPICSEIFPTFSLSYLGAHSYYPRGLIWRKGNPFNFKYGWDRGVSVPGALKLDHLQPSWAEFVPNNFHLPDLLLEWRGENEKKRFPPKMNETQGFHWLGYSNWTIFRFASCKFWMSEKLILRNRDILKLPRLMGRRPVCML